MHLHLKTHVFLEYGKTMILNLSPRPEKWQICSEYHLKTGQQWHQLICCWTWRENSKWTCSIGCTVHTQSGCAGHILNKSIFSKNRIDITANWRWYLLSPFWSYGWCLNSSVNVRYKYLYNWYKSGHHTFSHTHASSVKWS